MLLVFWDVERPVITSPAEGPFCLRSLHPAFSLSRPFTDVLHALANTDGETVRNDNGRDLYLTTTFQ